MEVASLGYYKGPNEDTDDGDQAKPKRVQTAEAPGPVELGCTTPPCYGAFAGLKLP